MIYRKGLRIPGVLFAIGLLFFACKSKPPPPAPPEKPYAVLVFESIEAADPGNLSLLFAVKIEDPIPSSGLAKLESWRVELNGQRAGAGFSLDFPADGFTPQKIAPLRLNMDLAVLKSQGLAPADNYKVNLITEWGLYPGNEAGRKSPPLAMLEVSGIAEFPGVQAPVFSVTAIAILKAELVNTRFRVALKIENPNPYPVEISTFNYELYGNGLLWADGMEKNPIPISAKSAIEGNLFLIMNFIDMDRNLLDQVARLEDVYYRFSGEAQIITGVEFLPAFTTGFNLSGYSQVLER